MCLTPKRLTATVRCCHSYAGNLGKETLTQNPGIAWILLERFPSAADSVSHSSGLATQLDSKLAQLFQVAKISNRRTNAVKKRSGHSRSLVAKTPTMTMVSVNHSTDRS